MVTLHKFVRKVSRYAISPIRRKNEVSDARGLRCPFEVQVLKYRLERM